MRSRKEIDKTLSAVVLIAYAVIWLINFILAQSGGVTDGVMRGIGIARTVMQVLTFVVLLYNAWGWSNNLIYRILILAVAVWLIFCTVAPYFPGLNIDAVYLFRA